MGRGRGQNTLLSTWSHSTTVLSPEYFTWLNNYAEQMQQENFVLLYFGLCKKQSAPGYKGSGYACMKFFVLAYCIFAPIKPSKAKEEGF
jgi:hypothetical protein